VIFISNFLISMCKSTCY